MEEHGKILSLTLEAVKFGIRHGVNVVNVYLVNPWWWFFSKEILMRLVVQISNVVPSPPQLFNNSGVVHHYCAVP